MSNNIIYLLILGVEGVGKSLMVSRMIGDLPILHLLKDNHSTPVTYPVIPEIGDPLKCKLVLQECSTLEELSTIIAENRHFPRNVVLMFHCGSETSFESCEAFYRMLLKDPTRHNFLWIANTDYSVEGTSGWRERIARLVNEPKPRFLATSLEDPDPDLRNIISFFFYDILENNQLATDKHYLDDKVSPYSGTTVFKVSKERFKGPWINDVQTVECCTQWQTGDRLISAPQVQSWIGGRDDKEEKSQGSAAMRRSASWSNWPLDTTQDKEDAVRASINRGSLQGLMNGKSDDEVGETLGKGCGKGCGAEENLTNREGPSILYEMSISNETSGWYPDDEEQAWVEGWRAYWSINVQWLRRLCFGCVGRR